MDKNIKQICKEIRSGRHLEEHIPLLFNYMAESYYTNASVRLAMHYFSYYENYCDDEGTWSKEALEYTDKINHIISDHILKAEGGVEREKAISEIDQIRKDITKRMDLLIAYTDIFQIFEYVLNRIEYRFNEEEFNFYDEEFAKEILRFIFETQDNVIINEKIKDMIGQLPVRITKQKYFELLKESIQAYLGSEKSTLETYLYMMKTSAMLYKEEGMDTFYSGLWEKKEFLSSLNYKNLIKEEYDKAESILRSATLMLEIETTVYFDLQEIVNEIYGLLLCTTYAGMVPSEFEQAKEAALAIIEEINQDFVNHVKKELSVDSMETFVHMEGVQEELSYDLSLMEEALFEIKQNYKPLTESLMVGQLLQVLLRTKDLVSNSLFVDLEALETQEEIVDEELIHKTVTSLERDLTELFANQDRMISRAIIANTISKMPVFFADHKEVMEYVLYSLERCSDQYEKAACYEIINDIMSE